MGQYVLWVEGTIGLKLGEGGNPKGKTWVLVSEGGRNARQRKQQRTPLVPWQGVGDVEQTRMLICPQWVLPVVYRTRVAFP